MAGSADAAAANPNDIKMLLDVLITFPIKGNLVFRNGQKNQSKNPPDCPI